MKEELEGSVGTSVRGFVWFLWEVDCGSFVDHFRKNLEGHSAVAMKLWSLLLGGGLLFKDIILFMSDEVNLHQSAGRRNITEKVCILDKLGPEIRTYEEESEQSGTMSPPTPTRML